MSNEFKAFAQGVISAGIYAIPVFGKVALAAEISEVPTALKETKKLWQEYPELRTSMITTGLAGAAGLVVGGAAIGKVKGTIKQQKIARALRESEIKYSYRGRLTEKTLKGLKISAEEKAELMTLLKQGRNLRIYEVKNIADSIGSNEIMNILDNSWEDSFERTNKNIANIMETL